jgi:hypothetical protein
MCNIKPHDRQAKIWRRGWDRCSVEAQVREEGGASEPHGVQQEQQLNADSGASVEHHVLPSSSARRQKALVPFVESRDQCGSEYGEASPSQSPFGIAACRERLPPRPEKENTQQGIAYDVSCLSNKEVPRFESRAIDSKEKMDDRVKEPTRVVRGQVRRRFDGDDDQPEYCGDPRL